MTRLIPRTPVPALTVPTLDGADWSIETAKPERFSLMVFYRGLHCPICSTYVAEFAKLAPDFAAKGVASIAISSDPVERASKARADWKLGDLAIGHSLAIETARSWGLFISSSRGKTSSGFEERRCSASRASSWCVPTSRCIGRRFSPCHSRGRTFARSSRRSIL